MSKYLLDANVFIQAKNLHYRFDFCQAFWDWIILAHQEGIVFSIEAVKQELNKGKPDDPLCQWIDKEALNHFFLPDMQNPSVIKNYQTLANWVNADTHYIQPAKNEFLRADIADAFLVAVAMTDDYIIVTHEKSNPNSKRRILIPDVAKAFNVNCILIYDLLSLYAQKTFQLKTV